MNGDKTLIVTTLNIIGVFYYFLVFYFLTNYYENWIYWLVFIFSLLNLFVSIKICFSKNNKICWNKKVIMLAIFIGLIPVTLFLVPAKDCMNSTKSSQLASCDCLGVIKNTSMFTMGCIGKRTACYSHLPYGGGVNKIKTNCD